MRIFSIQAFRPLQSAGRSPGSRPCPPEPGRGRLPGVLLQFAITVAALAPLPLEGQWPGEVRGYVLDARTGAGIAHASVGTAGATSAVRTGADGAFFLRVPDGGTVLLEVHRIGYASGEVTLEVTSGARASVTIHLSPMTLHLDEIRVESPAGPLPGHRFSREDIRGSGALTLGGLLESVPGTMLVRRGPGGEETLGIRGAPASHTLVLVDGVALNDPVTGVADLSLVSLGALASVTVLPGALGARYGAGAMGGVILVGTGGSPRGGEASMGVGSLGEGRAAIEGTAPVLGQRIVGRAWASRMDGTFAFRQDPRVGGEPGTRRNADQAEWGFRGAFGSRPAVPHGSWEVALQGSRLERGMPGKDYAPSPDARQSLEQWSLRARWERPLGPPRGPTVPGREGAETRDLRGGAPEVRLRVGVDRRFLHFRDPEPPLGTAFDDRSRLTLGDGAVETDGFLLPRGGVRLGGGVSGRLVRIRSDAVEFDSGEATTLEVGGFAHAERDALSLPGAPGIRVAGRVDRTRVGVLASHDLTVATSIWRARVHAAHRSSVRPPSPGDQFFREGVGVAPNPTLRPERIPGEIEVGASIPLELGAYSLRLAGVLHRGDIDDHIVWTPDYRFVWSPRNVDVRRRGATVHGELRAPKGLALSAHFTRASVQYRRAGGEASSQLAYRPRNSGAWTLDWRQGAFRIGGGAHYTGARFPVPAPINELAGFWTTQLRVSGRVSAGGWTAEPTLRIDRLLDERAPFIFSVPEPGRTFRLDLHLRRGFR